MLAGAFYNKSESGKAKWSGGADVLAQDAVGAYACGISACVEHEPSGEFDNRNGRARGQRLLMRTGCEEEQKRNGCQFCDKPDNL